MLDYKLACVEIQKDTEEFEKKEHTFAERVGISCDGLKSQAANSIKAPGNLGNRSRIEAPIVLPTDDQCLDIVDS